ncbi:toprim domain-containing protein [archaeon]|nr:toprim domain-containing protein [archaeon]
MSKSLDEELLEFFVKIFAEILRQDPIILVEGKRDVLALRRVAPHARLVAVKAVRGSLTALCDRIARQTSYVVVLFDFDEEGEYLTSKVSYLLSSSGVDVNVQCWRSLKDKFRSFANSIEALVQFVLSIEKRTGLQMLATLKTMGKPPPS